MQIYEKLMEAHGVKSTANRLLIARAMGAASRPLTMKELEDAIVTLDKSSIFRTLTVFREHNMVHVIEGGEGGVRYELCQSHHPDIDDDEHIHFYCERCHRTFCLYDQQLPNVVLPPHFTLTSASFLIHGICEECNS